VRHIIAIDPGTVTGYACSSGQHGAWDLTPAKARKRPPTEAEPEHARVGKLFARVSVAIGSYLFPFAPTTAQRVVVVCEGAAAFQRGKAAVRVSHELRGAVKAAVWHQASLLDDESRVSYLEIQPQDLKRFATGKANADKPEMVAAARRMCGYQGEDDNVADALLLLEWARKHVAIAAPNEIARPA